MNNFVPIDTVSEDDIAFLDAFLSSETSPERCYQVSDLDGFLTGIVVGPELILPSEWLPIVWGEEDSDFQDAGQAERVLQIIMGRYNEIIRVLDTSPEEFSPWFWVDEEGTVIASDWAEGFRDAIELRSAEWQPMLKDERCFEILIPIAAFWSNDDGVSLLELQSVAGDGDGLADKMTNRIPQAVIEIRQYWRDRLISNDR